MHAQPGRARVHGHRHPHAEEISTGQVRTETRTAQYNPSPIMTAARSDDLAVRGRWVRGRLGRTSYPRLTSNGDESGGRHAYRGRAARARARSVATVDAVGDGRRAARPRSPQYNVGALPVVDGGRLVGIVSERDVVRQLHARRRRAPAAARRRHHDHERHHLRAHRQDRGPRPGHDRAPVPAPAGRSRTTRWSASSASATW